MYFNLFQVDVKDAAGMNEVWIAWMKDTPTPARATDGTTALVDPRWKIEIVITAAVGGRGSKL